MHTQTLTACTCPPWVDCPHIEPWPPSTKPGHDTDDRDLCPRCNGGGIGYHGQVCNCSGGYRR